MSLSKCFLNQGGTSSKMVGPCKEKFIFGGIGFCASTKKHMNQNDEKDIDFIVWDLETTGFNAPDCKILEIGCFISKGGEIERKHWVLDNKVDIPDEIVKITGITPEIISAEGRDPRECLLEFLPLFKRCKQNITHNGIRFDIPFLVNTASHLFGYTGGQKENVTKLIRSTAFDTAVHFKAKKLNLKKRDDESFLEFADRVMEVKAFGVKYNLGLCKVEVGITKDLVQHRAMADVELTHDIYQIIKQ